ncbi:MAG TPA: 2'-5' RNA ligase family protein [Ktedonobacterales bacterium]|nr:2'-5' RNA ligase family protein [Ktedonobacterales bacterium]
MDGVVSLLDRTSEQVVRALWDELAERYDLRDGAQRVPHPHFSYHIAEGYDLARTEAALAHVAAQVQPFTVHVTGLGAFERPEEVLYLAVARNAALDRLHAALWRALAEDGVTQGASPLYAPDSWIPHITLAQGDLTLDLLHAIQSAWAERDVRREVWVSDLTLLSQTPGAASHTPAMRFALGSGERLDANDH